MNGMQNENKKLSEDAIKTINSSVDKFIEKSGLRAKDVKVVDCKTSGPAINLSGIKDSLESISNPTYATAQGKNAFLILQQMKLFLAEQKVQRLHSMK